MAGNGLLTATTLGRLAGSSAAEMVSYAVRNDKTDLLI
jgi:hypothetical protein